MGAVEQALLEIALDSFREQHPNELQEIVRLREVSLGAAGELLMVKGEKGRAGGRVNYHPIFPSGGNTWTTKLLADGGKILRAECGVGFCNALWQEGLYADLIPTSEIASGALQISADGLLQYGPQKYAAAVIYQPQCERPAPGGSCMAPQASGQCRLLDGTVIVDAIGVVAVRLTKDGAVEALACGGLKSFRGGGLTIKLPERIDMAAWRDANGKWQGVLQDYAGPVPDHLAALTASWKRLAVPTPYVSATSNTADQ